jgi:hypothetical protein
MIDVMVSDSNTEGVSFESVFGWRDGEWNKGDNVIRKDLLPSNTEFCEAQLSKSLGKNCPVVCRKVKDYVCLLRRSC